MSPKTKFFLTGVTGYIGATVLQRFLEHKDAANFEFSALVRSAEKAEKFKSEFGVNAVVGSLSDLELVEKLASEADVVVATADADDLDGALATLRGLKKRFQATGKQPIFINTSGTGVIAVDSRGMEQTEEIYDDMNPKQIESLSPTAPHRSVDLAIVAADKEGYVKTYIILPSTIYGISHGKLFDAGLANPISQQIPGLIKAALSRGRAGMIGAGRNLWPNVYIDEGLADLYTVLYDSIISNSNPATGHGREGFYFGANGEYKYYDVCKVIGETLVALGRAQDPEPTTFTEEEVKKYFGSAYLGSNSRCVSRRSYAIGWSPKKTTSDLFASVKPEVEHFIAKGL
ncbi:NAD-binding protein [Mycena floridula]|nr:NAD-binding protein [Mycena floridula]